MDLISYAELWTRHPGRALTLLAGNGLSIGANKSFDYRELAKSHGLSAKTQRIFTRLGQTNFEKVLEAMETTQTVLDELGEVAGAQQVREEYLRLQADLIGCILEAQPNHSHDIDVECGGFVRNFGRIFSLSYDLYLRHSIYVLNRDLAGLFRDGFTRKEDANRRYFEPTEDINLHYLHGGLNLFPTPGAANGHFFVTYDWSQKPRVAESKRVLPQVRKLIAMGILPVFVAHGTAAEKQKHIEADAYLSHAFDALKTLQGPLFIYGCSVQPNDDHIWGAIRDSAVSEVYVSCRTPADRMDIEYRTTKYLGKKSPILVDVSSAQVWTPKPGRRRRPAA